MNTTIKINDKVNSIVTLPTIEKKEIKKFLKIEEITDYSIEI